VERNDLMEAENKEIDELTAEDKQAFEIVDKLIEMYKEWSSSGNFIEVTNPLKEKLVKAVYEFMCNLTKGTNAKVTYSLNSPLTGSGCVSVNSSELCFINPRKLTPLMKLASNVDIYAKTDGSVQMDMTFNQVTRKIKVGEGEV